jgi:hypothetical protein
VAAPPAPEGVAAGGQLSDEVVHVLVEWVAAGFGAQDGDADVGGLAPLRVDAVGVLIEEGVAGEVGSADGVPVVQR